MRKKHDNKRKQFSGLQARSQPVAAGGAKSLVGRASLFDSTEIIGAICARCLAMRGNQWVLMIYTFFQVYFFFGRTYSKLIEIEKQERL